MKPITNSVPYSAYKDSGVGWLGKVPEHWEVRRLGQIGRLSKGRGGNKDDEVSIGVPCVRYGDLYTTHTYFILKSRSFVSRAKVENYTPIKFGDVLFAASGETIDEIGKSAVNLIQSEACCGGDVILFRPERQVEARYLGYATDCRPAAAQKATMGRGFTVMHIYGGQLKYLTLPLPPLPEQTAIVRYLDYTDRRVQRYIRAKQKLIILLEEQKQAIIHQVVTGQIDVRTGQPYPAYQDSGVEWLGEVPEHWERKRVKHASMILRGKFTHRPRNDPSLYGGPYPFIQTGDVARANKTITEYRQTLNEQGLTVSMMFPAGTLVMTIAANIGYVALLDFEACFPDSVVGFFPRLNVNRDYLYHLFLAMSTELQQEAPVNTQGNLNIDRIGSRPIALPPLPEQVAIARYLDRTTTDIDHAISHTQRQIDLLSEYRTRLISDVVTGKLDVREAAAALPEVDPLEAEVDSEETLEPTTELAEEFDTMAEGTSA